MAPGADRKGTDWFAVDRCGHVAHLDSGVSGAVPGGGGRDGASYADLLAALARSAPVTEPVFEVEGRLLPGLEAAADDLHVLESGSPVLAFVPSLASVSAEVALGEAVPVRAALGAAAIFERLPAVLSARLHGPGGACLGCFSEPDADRVDPSQFGLFSYRHLCDSWLAGPYGRRTRPSASLLIHQLPVELRGRLTALRFERVCFAEEPHLQPLDHFRCHATPPAWLDVGGRTVRPIRGRELEYRQFFFPRHRRDPRFLIERPPD